jgi:hypothetical protein
MPVLEKNGTKPLQNDRRVDKLFDYLETVLKIRAGYDIAFQCHHETAMALMLSIHPSRQKDLLTEHRIQFSNEIASHDYRDA